MTTQLPNTQSDYRAIIKSALQHLHDPAMLGTESLLATPYLLGHHLRGEAETGHSDATTRGNVLRRLIERAVATIAQDDNERPLPWARILELRYLADEPMKVADIILALNTSESAEARQHVKALDALVDELFKLLKPTLRLEVPLPSADLVGRQRELTTGLAQLADGKSIAIHGPSGIGKTTFGAALAHAFVPYAFFWFTIRPGLNDHVHNLIFALAYFLQQHGLPSTWQQIMADAGQVKEHTSSLLRHDLAQLAAQPLLLCVDEVDLLRPAEVQAHTQLVPFLESLRATVPLLLMGQKLTVDADHIINLSGLPFAAVQQMLTTNGIALDHDQLLTLHRQTQGNPRLIELFCARVQALRRTDLPLADALTDLAAEPSVELLLQRIWRHLNKAEMHLLELFALLQHPMPSTAWPAPADQQALATLRDWRLLHVDGQDGITMLPILHETITRLLDADEAVALHLEAAAICLHHRQFTAAGHHYQAGGLPALTVHLLHEHLDVELDQGQAFAIQRTLNGIAAQQLTTPKERELLRLLKVRIQQILGEHAGALVEIQKSLWKVPFLKAQADRFKGDILELQDEPQRALRAYRAAVETIEEWVQESANLQRAMGYLHANERTFANAHLAVWRIRHDAANLEGHLLLQQGAMAEAETAYLAAINFAQQAQYLYGEANAKMNLGGIYGWRKDIEQAEHYLQGAIDFFGTTGRTNKLAEATYNLALVRRLAGRFQEAIEPAEEALALFTKLGRALGCAYASQILAEVFVELNALTQAEDCARSVLNTENINAHPDALRVLGEIRLKQGELAEAERCIRDSQQMAHQNDDPVLVGYALRSLAKVLHAQNAQDAAQDALTAAIQVFCDTNMPAEAASTQQLLDEYFVFCIFSINSG